MAKKYISICSLVIGVCFLVITFLCTVGCGTRRVASYGAEIGDSMFIYIRNLPYETKETCMYFINVYYNYLDNTYILAVYNDSIGISDESEYLGKFPIKRGKNDILITKRNANSELFRLPELDSVKLKKVSNSYIDKRENRKYIRKSHHYELVIYRNENLNKKKKK
jgi:hypothetical protein